MGSEEWETPGLVWTFPFPLPTSRFPLVFISTPPRGYVVDLRRDAASRRSVSHFDRGGFRPSGRSGPRRRCSARPPPARSASSRRAARKTSSRELPWTTGRDRSRGRTRPPHPGPRRAEGGTDRSVSSGNRRLAFIEDVLHPLDLLERVQRIPTE